MHRIFSSEFMWVFVVMNISEIGFENGFMVDAYAQQTYMQWAHLKRIIHRHRSESFICRLCDPVGLDSQAALRRYCLMCHLHNSDWSSRRERGTFVWIEIPLPSEKKEMEIVWFWLNRSGVQDKYHESKRMRKANISPHLQIASRLCE